MSRAIAGLAAIADLFDAVLVDQYGVLHDGQAPFPGAVACLEALQARGIPVVAVTNSGKRPAENGARLAQLGFAPDLFHAIVSSGEVARDEIAARLASGDLAPGARIVILSRDDDEGPIEGLDVRRCPPSPDADLLIIAGVEPERRERRHYAELLAPLAARGVPALCVNPDRFMYVAGEARFAPGIVADDYAAAGGPVAVLGKPAAAMFEAALRAVDGVARERVLMIGDSPEHDIAGAARAGCATLLIRGGIQSGLGDGAVAPDFITDRLTWDARAEAGSRD